MTSYAARTDVPVDQSRNEIEKTLSRYGATAFAYAWQGNKASIQFEASGRRIRFLLPLPNPDERRFTHTATQGQRRSAEAQRKAVEQASRQAWRALLLIVKAKLEAVQSGIVTFEDEFLAHIVLPDGRTVGEHTRPTIALAYERSQVPPLLPDYSGEK